MTRSTREHLATLTGVEIRELGVERFGWREHWPAARSSREELIEYFVLFEAARATAETGRTKAARGYLETLTREEIWRLGVERFGWHGEEPRGSKEELVRWFLIDQRYEDFVDPADSDREE